MKRFDSFQFATTECFRRLQRSTPPTSFTSRSESLAGLLGTSRTSTKSGILRTTSKIGRHLSWLFVSRLCNACFWNFADQFSPIKKDGGQDFRLVESESLGMFNTLQRLGIPSRLVYFEKENHWVLNPSNSVRWHEEVFRWIGEFTAIQA